ncbi:hypothetical protein [Streptomyces murinus]|uniref:Large membrane protein n=1 Tax=Streptomyces murinus TaxID=33900 RepID=A0A7W3RLD6_STRMR|nr:hypothetical protein [Streptomyces murinus]MBA9053174.1 hypothetical protein [Streptomyces murinus]UWW94332.1 hypothetical protein GO605_28465 [Streptomyces murinus]
MNTERPENTGDAPEVPDVREAGRSRRRSRAVVLSALAAVLLIGGGGAYVAASDGPGGRTAPTAADSTTPPPLALDDGSDPYGAHYVAQGALPEGPGSAAVYGAGAEVRADQVLRLAKALGVSGTPVAEGHGWRIGGKDGSGPTLQVNRDAPGSWTFSRYAPGTDDCKKGPLCATGPVGPTGAPVSAAVAERAAAPVLRAAGLEGARTDAGQVMGKQRVVTADPVVGGLPTTGWATGLTISGQGEAVGGHGLLSTPVKGATYPVLDAKKTLALMNAAPKGDHRMGAGGCASPGRFATRLEGPCGQASPGSGTATVTVDKAVFGLAAHSVGGRQTLVPSWLFGTRDSGTVSYPAVDPRYLTSSAPSGSPTAAPGGSVKVTGYTADDRSLTVSFYGGLCADYSVAARESATRVTVTVTEHRQEGKICPMIAKEFTRTVRLKAPVDGRAVVGADGTRIPQAKQGALRP